MSDVQKLGLFDRYFLLGALLVLIIVVLILSFILPTVFVWIVFNSVVLFGILIYVFLYVAYPKSGKSMPPKRFPTISVIIPVFNSKNTIEECIRTVKKIKYPKKIDIIVVDDCCTDGTTQILKKIKGITLIKQPKNMGRSMAVNAGIKKAKTEMIMCIDSDSYPEEGILYKTLGYFEDEKVAAVTGLALPDKTKTIIQKIQYFEYLSSFGMNNSLLASIDSSHVVPGPMTIFRKKIFDELGGFEAGNLTEDTEYGLRLKKHGYKIMCAADALTLTDVPNSWKSLFTQRDRWYRGATFNFVRYKSLMFDKKNPDFGFFVMPFVFFANVLTIAVLLRLIILFAIDLENYLSITINYIMLGGLINLDFIMLTVPPSVIFFAMTYIVVTLYFSISFAFAKRWPKVSDLPVLAMLIFIYPYFITFTYTLSYFKEMLGVKTKWVRVST